MGLVLRWVRVVVALTWRKTQGDRTKAAPEGKDSRSAPPPSSGAPPPPPPPPPPSSACSSCHAPGVYARMLFTLDGLRFTQIE